MVEGSEFRHRLLWQQEQDGSPTPNQEDDDETSEGDEWAGRGSDLPGVPFKTTLKGHIAMETRTVSEEAGRGLAEPYIPRANIAAMPEKPIISTSFSWFTSDSLIPNPLFPINLKHIHRAKHGSDTGT
ncbi:hypothetical protein Rt10032_c22g6598 [Rhodotorula toruloides]|uniref:Uncharacterized protein n=1 Tax=Rhodotorula toruloides TaxID=5286 RepID=A0A511KQE7_RHOTO|nr:hypothetical protein Rt10032_c22g6598 [Rhodotorula toruloides]